MAFTCCCRGGEGVFATEGVSQAPFTLEHIHRFTGERLEGVARFGSISGAAGTHRCVLTWKYTETQKKTA